MVHGNDNENKTIGIIAIIIIVVLAIIGLYFFFSSHRPPTALKAQNNGSVHVPLEAPAPLNAGKQY